jgi:hypothetical protein
MTVARERNIDGASSASNIVNWWPQHFQEGDETDQEPNYTVASKQLLMQ